MEIATMTSAGVMAASGSMFSANGEEEEKLSHSDSDYWTCNYSYTKCPTTPSSDFQRASPPGAEDILVRESIDEHQLSNIDHKKHKDDDIEACHIRYYLARYLYTLPSIWGIFRRINNPDLLEHAIQLGATLLLLLIPEDIICPITRSPKRVTQLNHLWEKLRVLLTTCCPPPDSLVEEAFLLIIKHISSDRQQYSLVTETDVSDMIDHFCRILQLYPIDPPNPYLFIGNESKEMTPLFERILEVLNSIELPPKLKLEAGEHTHFLMKILNDEPVKDQLLDKLNVKLVPDSHGECSHPFLKLGYCNLVKRVISVVKELLIGRLSSVQSLFSNFYNKKYTSYNISSEVCGLIHVAEVRRIALGSRFISRSHLLWAFYECGYVLPPQIRETINFTSAGEDHPPYHIYLVSMKLAEHYSEVVQLKTFIFSIIISGDIRLGVDKSEMMKSIVERYELFLEDLNKPSSSGPKRPRIC